MPVMLGVFPHRDAERCGCVAPACDAKAVGFATILWKGVVILPLCLEHGSVAAALDKVDLPYEYEPAEESFGKRILIVPNGGTYGRKMWTILREHCP